MYISEKLVWECIQNYSRWYVWWL